MTATDTPATARRCPECRGPLPTIPSVGYTPTVCPACVTAQEAQCVDEHDQDVERLLERANPPARIAQRTLTEFANDRHLADFDIARMWLSRYRSGSSQNLILVGSPGVGKTTLAWATAHELIRHQFVPVRFVVFRDLIWDMRQAMQTDSPCHLAERAQTTRLLILDDLGAERLTDWARSELATLIDRRYGNQLPTIVTTNYTATELGERIGQHDPHEGHRIVGRLTENAIVHRMAAPTYRTPARTPETTG